jgi:ferredoxin
MAYVVAEPCVACKYTDCVAVCPVDCFYEGENMVVINPDECIDCGACEPECPVNAIFEEDELPEKWSDYMEINERLSSSGQWPNITDQKDPLPECDKFKDVEDKRAMLSENPPS